MSDLIREGWTLTRTCSACPEQYEIHDHEGNIKAYMRLRWGHFSVSCPDVGGEVVFSHTWEGDEYKGSFDTPDEQRTMLDQAAAAVEDWWRKMQPSAALDGGPNSDGSAGVER